MSILRWSGFLDCERRECFYFKGIGDGYVKYKNHIYVEREIVDS